MEENHEECVESFVSCQSCIDWIIWKASTFLLSQLRQPQSSNPIFYSLITYARCAFFTTTLFGLYFLLNITLTIFNPLPTFNFKAA